MLDGTYHFECECGSHEHLFTATLDKEDPDFPVVYLDLQLTQNRPLWKRFWVALCYLCGYKCRYGAWEEIILGKKEARKLQDVLQQLSNEQK